MADEIRPDDSSRVGPVEDQLDAQWPPPVPDAPKRPVALWTKVLVGLAIVVVVVIIAGTVIRVPYTTLAPGGALDLSPRVSVTGTKSYPDRSDVMMLFVRERAHVNLWSWLQGKLDPDIDLVKQENITGDRSQHETDLADVCDMAQSQDDARVAALTALGYKVPVLPGLAVEGLPHTFGTEGKDGVIVKHPLFAYKVLQPCDTILSADGKELEHAEDLSKTVKTHKAGSSVTLGIKRAGKPLTVRVPVVQGPEAPIIGVSLALRYKIPLDVDIDTKDISGPSAGLAITLAIIDAMTPGELTGGKKLAVTGTIDPSGRVGEIGGLPQKALAARNAGAQILIVPKCAPSETGCLKDVETARKRVGKGVEVAPVSTLDEALKVLRDAGGAPVPTQASV